MIQTSTATIYHGGGRRYLTAKAACRAEARKLVKKHLRAMGEDWDDDWCRPRIERLARLYRRSLATNLPNEEEKEVGNGLQD